MNALNKAIKQANGVAALARMLGCSENLPTMWKRRGRVPLEWCPAIERATGVTCEALRPDCLCASWQLSWCDAASPGVC